MFPVYRHIKDIQKKLGLSYKKAKKIMNEEIHEIKVDDKMI